MLVAAAKLTQPDLLARAARTGRAQLVIIPYSHYCELAVWALSRPSSAIKDAEVHAFAPGQHILPVLRNRVANVHGSPRRSTSSNIRDTLVRNGAPSFSLASSSAAAGARGAATAVPLLCMPDGRVLRDSWEILQVAEGGCVDSGAKAIDAAMLGLLDTELGPLARQLAYAGLLKPSNRNIWNELVAPTRGGSGSDDSSGSDNSGSGSSGSDSSGSGSSFLWRACWYGAGAGDALTGRMAGMFGVEDAAVARECRERLRDVFSRLAAELEAHREAQRRRRGRSDGAASTTSHHLTSPSAVDVAVAALAAPVVMPPLFCGGKYRGIFEALLKQDPEWAAEADAWRATPVGQHTLRVYAEHRLPAI